MLFQNVSKCNILMRPLPTLIPNPSWSISFGLLFLQRHPYLLRIIFRVLTRLFKYLNSWWVLMNQRGVTLVIISKSLSNRTAGFSSVGSFYLLVLIISEIFLNWDLWIPKILMKIWWLFQSFKESLRALVGVAQWIERQPANQRVAGSIPSQGTCLDSRPGPQ